MMLIGSGLFIRYLINMRRFNRRGLGGLQHFSSYGKAVCTTAIERLIRLLATLCLLAGLWLLFNHLTK